MNQAKINLRSLPKQIADRLNELRRRLTTWVLIKGLSRWLMLVLAVVAFDILLDRMFKMDFATTRHHVDRDDFGGNWAFLLASHSAAVEASVRRRFAA